MTAESSANRSKYHQRRVDDALSALARLLGRAAARDAMADMKIAGANDQSSSTEHEKTTLPNNETDKK